MISSNSNHSGGLTHENILSALAARSFRCHPDAVSRGHVRMELFQGRPGIGLQDASGGGYRSTFIMVVVLGLVTYILNLFIHKP